MVFAKSPRRGRLRWLGGGSPEKDGPENEHAPEGPALVVAPMSAPPGQIVFVRVLASGLPPRANNVGPLRGDGCFLVLGWSQGFRPKLIAPASPGHIDSHVNE